MPKDKSEFEYRRWGKEFKDGKLYSFRRDAVVVLTPWPNPKAYVKRKSHGWQCTRLWADRAISEHIRFKDPKYWKEPRRGPDDLNEQGLTAADAVIAATASEEDRARYAWWENRVRKDKRSMAKFMRPVPREVRKMVRQYGDRNWHILNIFARCPGAADLHRSNPALLMALANSWSFQEEPVQKPMRAVRTLIFKKQREILRWLGFPATENCRKILAKIPPDSLKLKQLLWLRHWMKDERVVKLLSHLDRVNELVIHIVTSEQRLAAVTPRLLRQVSHIKNKHRMEDVECVLGDIFRMQRRVLWRECPTSFRSLTHLQRVHDELVERINAFTESPRASYPASFPDPPFKGTSTIWPITAPADLISEGAEQRNCVASYCDTVLNGHDYIYRVYHPVRATLSIRRAGDRWVPGQLERACNNKVVGELREQLFEQLFTSGPYVPPKEEEPEDERDDPQLPLGMTQEAWNVVQLVEESFGRSQRIEIELPAERISA